MEYNLTYIAILVALVAVYLGRKRSGKAPPFLTDDAVPGPLKSARMFIKSNKLPGAIFSEGFDTMLTKIGVINTFITDPEVAKKLFMTDGANGHDEMAKWFATVMQYHNLYYPHKEQLELDAVGIVRNMNALDPVCTQRAKLMRKRVLEGSSQKFTKSVIDEQIPAFIEELMDSAEKFPEGFDSMDALMGAATNVILKMTAGLVIDPRSENMQKLKVWINFAINSLVKMDPWKLLFLYTPVRLRALIPLKWWPKWCHDVLGFYDFVMDDFVKPWEKNFDKDAAPNCMLDLLLVDVHQGKLTRTDLVNVVFNMLFAGSDTTATQARNVFIFLSQQPELQERIYQELAAFDFKPKSLKSCPLFESTLSETMRFGPSLYRSLLHTTTKPINIGPFGPFAVESLVSLGISGINMNEKYFPEPFNFKAERFLDENKEFKDPKNLHTFSIGARRCPGEDTARGEIFRFTVAVLEQFKLTNKISMRQGSEEEWLKTWDPLGYKSKNGHFLMPEHVDTIFTLRK